MRLLLVEDEESFVQALQVGLAREGFDVVVARTGPEGLDAFAESPPELVLLDLMLPGMSGIDVCRKIRECSSVPIIMVTAKNTELDKVLGLELGADDYVTKPFSLRELVARIRAVLRRAAGEDVFAREIGVLSARDIVMDLDAHTVSVRGHEVELALKEFQILEVLLDNAGRVMPRHRLLDLVWGDDYVGDTKTLDVHIRRLRGKVEPDPPHPTHIVTVRGVGYKFELKK
jgi:two-component system, OmpR family, response regulator RegX3